MTEEQTTSPAPQPSESAAPVPHEPSPAGERETVSLSTVVANVRAQAEAQRKPAPVRLYPPFTLAPTCGIAFAMPRKPAFPAPSVGQMVMINADLRTALRDALELVSAAEKKLEAKTQALQNRNRECDSHADRANQALHDNRQLQLTIDLQFAGFDEIRDALRPLGYANGLIVTFLKQLSQQVTRERAEHVEELNRQTTRHARQIREWANACGKTGSWADPSNVKAPLIQFPEVAS